MKSSLTKIQKLGFKFYIRNWINDIKNENNPDFLVYIQDYKDFDIQIIDTSTETEISLERDYELVTNRKFISLLKNEFSK